MRKEKLNELNRIIDELKTIKFDESDDNKRFIETKKYLCTLNNGFVIPREKIIKGHGDGSAVIVMPVLENGEIITVIEPRVFTRTSVGVGFPAGYIEKGEEPNLGALRELHEETGYVPNELIYLDSFYQDDGCSSAYNHCYLALDCNKKYEQHLDEYEIVKYMTFSYDEILELVSLGYINGVNSKYTLEKAKEYIRRRK